MGGCKCMLCRAANSRYETGRDALRRAGLSNGVVSADRTRAELRRLSRRGIGYKTAAMNAGVSRTNLAKVLFGGRLHVRAMTEKRVLELGGQRVADHALIRAGQSWRRLRWLINQGFSKTEIARRLGQRAHPPALQIGRTQITGRNARKIEQLWRSFQ
jgi:hypothetical protein